MRIHTPRLRGGLAIDGRSALEREVLLFCDAWQGAYEKLNLLLISLTKRHQGPPGTVIR